MGSQKGLLKKMKFESLKNKNKMRKRKIKSIILVLRLVIYIIKDQNHKTNILIPRKNLLNKK